MAASTAPVPAGFDLPAFQHGFSTHWMDVDRDPAPWFAGVLAAAIEVGYRRFDCNPVWDTEPMLGAAIRDAGIGRDELFVTTVVPYSQLGERTAHDSVMASLDRLGLDRLDAVFVSAPISGWDVEGTAAAMNSLVEAGHVRRIGARYMSRPDLDAFMGQLAGPMFAHLTELHPLWHADELRHHAVEHRYWLIADSPLMQGVVGEIREIRDAVTRTGATPFQVTLAWLHRLGNVATSTWVHDRGRMADNLAADRVELGHELADRISSISRRWSASPQLHPVPPH